MPNTVAITVASAVGEWHVYRKTKGLIALPASVVLDMSGDWVSKLLINTLEGSAPVRKDAMVCIGPAGEVWQQGAEKLFAKYDATGVVGLGQRNAGWINFVPKDSPATRVKATQVTATMAGGDASNRVVLHNCHWGEKQPDGTYAQYAAVGAWLVVRPDDPTDAYFIEEAVFDDTYSKV